MIYGVTGHRDVDAEPGELLMFAGLCVDMMVQRGCTEIITGMARGWDLKIARAASDRDVPYCAAVPFPGQETTWAEDDQREYERAMHLSSRIVVTGMLPLTVSYHVRDKWIVEHSEELWALNSGRPSGTRTTVLFAEQKGRTVRELWEPWLRFRAERN